MSEKLTVFEALYKEKATKDVERHTELRTKAKEKLNRAITLWTQIKEEAEKLGIGKQFSEAFPEAGGNVLVTEIDGSPNSSYNTFFGYDDPLKNKVRELTKLANATDKLKNAENNLANAQLRLTRKPEDQLKIIVNGLFQAAADSNVPPNDFFDSLFGKKSNYDNFEETMLSLDDNIDGPPLVNNSQSAYDILKEKFEAGELNATSEKKESQGPINAPPVTEKKETDVPSSAINQTDLAKKEADKSTINTEEKKEEKKTETKLEAGGTGVPASTLKEGTIDLAANTGADKKNEKTADVEPQKNVTGGIFTKSDAKLEEKIVEGKKEGREFVKSKSSKIADKLLEEVENSATNVVNEQKNVTNNTSNQNTTNTTVNNVVNDGTKNETKGGTSIVNENNAIDLAQGGATTTTTSTTNVSNTSNTSIDLAANTGANKKTEADIEAETKAKARKDLTGGIFTKGDFSIGTRIVDGKEAGKQFLKSKSKSLTDKLLEQVEGESAINDTNKTGAQDNLDKTSEDQTKLDSENKKLPTEGNIDLANPNPQSQDINVTKTSPSIPEEKPKEEIKSQMQQNQQGGGGQVDLASSKPETTTSQNQGSTSTGGQPERRETMQPMPQNFNALESRLARIETILSGPLDVKIVT